MWMNEHDVKDARERYDDDEHPNLLEGALVLWRLMVWVNNNSDGWAYWAKPGNASAKLQDLLYEGLHKWDAVDCTQPEIRATFAPIKAFLTRQKVAHETVFPTPPTKQEKADAKQSALHILVHEVAHQVAADCLNLGKGEEYLLTNGWTSAQIDEWLTNYAKDNQS